MSIGFQGSVRKVGGRALPQYFVLIGGGETDSGAAFGRVVAKIPVRRLPDAVERLLALYQAGRSEGESLSAYFRRLPTTEAQSALRDLEAATAEQVSEQDFVDLEEQAEFAPEVLDGECSA